MSYIPGRDSPHQWPGRYRKRGGEGDERIRDIEIEDLLAALAANRGTAISEG